MGNKIMWVFLTFFYIIYYLMLYLLLIHPNRCKNILQILILKKSRARHFQLGSDLGFHTRPSYCREFWVYYSMFCIQIP